MEDLQIKPYADEFKAVMAEQGYPVRIGEMRRTQARQDFLYAQGRTAPGAVVTWTRNSKHIRGLAFDFDFVTSADNQDPDAWELAGEVGEWLGLVWGGRWDLQDYRHFELPT